MRGVSFDGYAGRVEVGTYTPFIVVYIYQGRCIVKGSDRIKVEMSKARERLAVLSGKDNATDEERNEMRSLTDQYGNLETRLQAAIVSESAEDAEAIRDGQETADAEARELFGIYERASVGRYVQHAAEGRSLSDGPERELNDGLSIHGERMPLLMLLDPEDRAEDRADNRVEYRADAVTSITANTMQNPTMWLNRVFEGTASEFLGVTRRSVSGLAAFPVVGSGATAETTGKGTAKDSEAFGLSVETLDPKRITARYVFSREDAARLGMTFETTMRGDLRMSLANNMDNEIINGSGTIIDGLLDETAKTISDAADAALSDATDGQALAQGLAGLIDGKYAMTTGDIRAVFNPSFYGYMRVLPIIFTNTDGYLSTWFEMEKINVMAAGHIDEITGQAGESYLIASLARGLSGAAVSAVWDSVELVRDPYTGAAKGEIALTVCGLHNFKVLRSDNFAVRRVARS